MLNNPRRRVREEGSRHPLLVLGRRTRAERGATPGSTAVRVLTLAEAPVLMACRTGDAQGRSACTRSAPPNGFALPLDHVAGVWWKHAVHRVLIGGKRGTLTRSTSRMMAFIMSGNGIADAHPAAMQRGGERPFALLVPAKTLRVRDQFARKLLSLAGNFEEQLLHVPRYHDSPHSKPRSPSRQVSIRWFRVPRSVRSGMFSSVLAEVRGQGECQVPPGVLPRAGVIAQLSSGKSARRRNNSPIRRGD